MDDPRVLVLQMTMAMRTSRALNVAVELGIADHLVNGPLDSAALAGAVGANSGAIRRLMRALSALGVFSEDAPGRYSLTELGDHLRGDHPRSLRSAVRFLAGTIRWQLWSDLLESVRTGETATERLFGCGIFDYYAAHPAEEALMNENMRAHTCLAAQAILAAFDFSHFNVVMDVGGGTGQLISSILVAHPHLRGVLFDRPSVVASARPVLEQHAVADRCACSAGDFFTEVPRGADAIMLKYIVHDWDDARAVSLLTGCRAAMPKGGRLLLIEHLMPQRAERGIPVDPFLLDLEMLVGAGGCERTESEFRALLSAAGLALVSVTPTNMSALSIIEARHASELTC